MAFRMFRVAGPTLLPLLLLLLAGILVIEDDLAVDEPRCFLSSVEPFDPVEPVEPLRRSLVRARMAEVYLPRWCWFALLVGLPMFLTVLTEVALLSELLELRKLLRDPDLSTASWFFKLFFTGTIPPIVDEVTPLRFIPLLSRLLLLTKIFCKLSFIILIKL